jgi:hypothetical protein
MSLQKSQRNGIANQGKCILLFRTLAGKKFRALSNFTAKKSKPYSAKVPELRCAYSVLQTISVNKDRSAKSFTKMDN